jgi:hypothetical protein
MLIADGTNMDSEQQVAICFKKKWPPYNAGDRANVPAEKAWLLVRHGTAHYADWKVAWNERLRMAGRWIRNPREEFERSRMVSLYVGGSPDDPNFEMLWCIPKSSSWLRRVTGSIRQNWTLFVWNVAAGVAVVVIAAALGLP